MLCLPRFTYGIIFLFFLLIALPVNAEDNRVEVHPTDHGKALINPQMGWTFHFYSNVLNDYGGKIASSDTLDDFPGLSCIYLRLPWSYIEPAEGKFQWSVVDAPSQRWIDKGLQVAFRFTACESWMAYATPKWVKEAGAKGNKYTYGKGADPQGPFWEPDYGDPIFLAKHRQFLEAAAKRYESNPNVAFIDVGSVGVWGEGHTVWSSKLPISAETFRKNLDMYADAFKNTLLVMGDDFTTLGKGSGPGDKSVIAHALQLGMTLRDDSLCVFPPPNSYCNAAMAGPFWPKVPVILETDHYEGAVRQSRWSRESILQAIEDYHASYLSIHASPREFLETQRELIDQVNRRLGYRLQLRDASWPAVVKRGESIVFRSAWANVGVSPCYPGGWIAWTLKDSGGGIVTVYVDELFNVRNLEVAALVDKAVIKTVESTHGFAPNMPAGYFDVFISVGQHDGTPKIALPLSNDDGHRRYRLGRVEIQ